MKGYEEAAKLEKLTNELLEKNPITIVSVWTGYGLP